LGEWAGKGRSAQPRQKPDAPFMAWRRIERDACVTSSDATIRLSADHPQPGRIRTSQAVDSCHWRGGVGMDVHITCESPRWKSKPHHTDVLNQVCKRKRVFDDLHDLPPIEQNAGGNVRTEFIRCRYGPCASKPCTCGLGKARQIHERVCRRSVAAKISPEKT
jgi:hypothetical protein